jgi:hypothetical protein
LHPPRLPLHGGEPRSRESVFSVDMGLAEATSASPQSKEDRFGRRLVLILASMAVCLLCFVDWLNSASSPRFAFLNGQRPYGHLIGAKVEIYWFDFEVPAYERFEEEMKNELEQAGFVVGARSKPGQLSFVNRMKEIELMRARAVGAYNGSSWVLSAQADNHVLIKISTKRDPRFKSVKDWLWRLLP